MNKYRIVFTQVGMAEPEPYDLPKLGPDEILIEMSYSILSAGTEKACLLDMPNTLANFPKYLGYSGSGEVIQVGSDVQNIKLGDKVLADHLGHASHAIAKANDVVKIEYPNVSMLEAAFVVIGSMGLQGVRKAKIELGESVMVMGLGILGMFALQTARLSGGTPVIAVDMDEKRLELAKTLGADYAISPLAPDFAEKIKEFTRGRMVNATIEVTGSFKALQQALEVAAWQGRITLTGCTRVSDGGIDFYSQVHKPGISIIGAHNFVRPTADSYPGYWTRHDDFRALLELMNRNRLSVTPLISEVVSPASAPEVYKRLVTEKEMPLGIVFDWKKI